MSTFDIIASIDSIQKGETRDVNNGNIDFNQSLDNEQQDVVHGPYSAAELVQEHLSQFSKLYRLMLELMQRITAINNDISKAFLTTSETFSKKLNELTKDKEAPYRNFISFFENVLRHVEEDGKTLQTLSSRLEEDVIEPLQNDFRDKEILWKNCFQYINSYKDNIKKREDDMVRSHKEYDEANSKVKTSSDPKLLAYAYNSHNTYVLQSSSLQSLNSLLSTFVLDRMKNILLDNQQDLKKNIGKQFKLFFESQRVALLKLVKTNEKREEAIETFDIVNELEDFMNGSSFKTGFQETKVVKVQNSFRRSFYMERTISVSEPRKHVLTANEHTQPNLLRTIISIKNQKMEVEEEIASMRCSMIEEKSNSLKKLQSILAICDKEVITLALQNQLELFTSEVLDNLGYSLDDSSFDRRTPSTIPLRRRQKAHRYIEAKLVKPQVCNYCNKWMTVITRGLTCDICRINVHKKCVMKVPFCNVKVKKNTMPKQRRSIFKTTNNNIYSSQREWDQYFTPPAGEEPVIQPTDSLDSDVFIDCNNTETHYLQHNVDYHCDQPSSEEEKDDETEETQEELYFNSAVNEDLEGNPSINGKQIAELKTEQYTLDGEPEPYANANIYLSPVELFKQSKENSIKPPVYAKVSSESKLWKAAEKSTKENWRRHSMPEISSELQVRLKEIYSDEEPAEECGHIYQLPSGSPQEKIKSGCECEDDKDANTLYSNFPLLVKKERVLLKNKVMKPMVPPRNKPELPALYEVMFPVLPSKTSNPNRARSTPANSVAPFVKVSPKPKLRATSLESILHEKSESPYTMYQDNIGFCVALYDFNPSQEGGLELTASKRIELLQKTNDDWWQGRDNDKVGYFPSKYVLEINEHDVILRVLYDFNQQRENELSIVESQVLVMIQKTGNWFEVRSNNGTGLVPASYVEFAERRYMKIGHS